MFRHLRKLEAEPGSLSKRRLWMCFLSSFAALQIPGLKVFRSTFASGGRDITPIRLCHVRSDFSIEFHVHRRLENEGYQILGIIVLALPLEQVLLKTLFTELWEWAARKEFPASL